ncbi:MAG: dephospho-CoA kinase [Formivibrio sp.]|nr:dephospho-CoA kinase [Formivibrio sp.]
MALPKHWIIGLTGGIGSGKSCAARRFQSLGVRVIDTDDISHTLAQPPSPALERIASRLGPEFLTAGGALDRVRMREHIFAHPEARKSLEAILHPLILQEVQRQIAEPTAAPYTILVVPLLFETPLFRALIQRNVVVDCSEEEQIARVTIRNNLSKAEIVAIMSSQLPRNARLKQADDIIFNDGTLSHLEDQVTTLHQRFLQLANSVQ